MDGIDATKGLNFGAQFVGSSLYTGLYTKPEGSSGQSFRGFWIPSVRVYVCVCVCIVHRLTSALLTSTGPLGYHRFIRRLPR